MATYAGSISPDLFPRAADYAALARPAPDAVREPPARHPPFLHTERHLQCVWFDARLRPPRLVTSDGEPVTVETPGAWNLEAGPDFLGAVLRIGPGRRRIKGDVEVHVHPADWRSHGHATDPRYARVRAHVTYLPGTVEPGLFAPGTLHIALRDALAADSCFSFDAVDLAAYPYAAPGEDAPCRTLLAGWSPPERALLLDAAGEERLRRRAERLAASARERGPAQVLYEQILCALGFKQNKAPFRTLAERVPLDALRREAGGEQSVAYAIFLGVSGLLPRQAGGRWDQETRAFVRRLWDTWWKQKEKWEVRAMTREAWNLAGMRPANHPTRRLAAAARLFTREEPFTASVLRLARQHPKDFARRAAALLEDTPGGYWERRLSLGGAKRRDPVSLIGRERAGAIVTNVLVPFCAATGTPAPFGRDVLGQLPAEADNAIVRRIAHTLFGRDHNPALYRSALRRQGLIQIFHDFCLNDRSRCADCPLPAALSRFSTTNRP